MTSHKISINNIWNRIKKFEDETFYTKTNKQFIYSISGNVFRVNRTKYNISKSEFTKAFALVPFDGPGVINNLVRGPAYVWAVLHDIRIRKQDW